MHEKSANFSAGLEKYNKIGTGFYVLKKYPARHTAKGSSLTVNSWISPEMVHGNSLSLSGNQTSPFPLVTSSLLNGTTQEGTIKLNTDRAAKNIPGTGGLGGVFRDHNDKWLLDFYESLAHTSPVEAELKAIRRGLQLAVQHNFMHLQVETDSKEAVEGIMSEEGPKSPESEWVINIKEKLEQAKQDNDAGSWAKLSIYRVPLSLRRDDDKAYIPQIVSLGPYHHGKRRLRNMDRHKWRAVFHILKRTDQEIKMYIDSVRELEEKARACYEGTIAMSSNEFVEMMVLDSCFILELFRGVAGGFKHLGYARDDQVFAMRGSMHSIQRDMIMIENQIPLFILDRLYGTNLICLMRKETGPKSPPKVWIKHPSHSSRVADKRRQQMIHSVSELREAGVKFKKRKTDRFRDVKFKNGILKMPRLLIHDGTKSLFLNLIAFEQCHLDCTNDITSYVIFLDINDSYLSQLSEVLL